MLIMQNETMTVPLNIKLSLFFLPIPFSRREHVHLL